MWLKCNKQYETKKKYTYPEHGIKYTIWCLYFIINTLESIIQGNDIICYTFYVILNLIVMQIVLVLKSNIPSQTYCFFIVPFIQSISFKCSLYKHINSILFSKTSSSSSSVSMAQFIVPRTCCFLRFHASVSVSNI